MYVCFQPGRGRAGPLHVGSDRQLRMEPGLQLTIRPRLHRQEGRQQAQAQEVGQVVRQVQLRPRSLG